MAEEFIEFAKRYFGIQGSESATLLEITRRCAKTYGVVGAGTVGAWSASAGMVALPGVGAVPGWVAGALAGFVGFTFACTVAHRANLEGVKRILSNGGHTESDFKREVRRMLKRKTQSA